MGGGWGKCALIQWNHCWEWLLNGPWKLVCLWSFHQNSKWHGKYWIRLKTVIRGGFTVNVSLCILYENVHVITCVYVCPQVQLEVIWAHVFFKNKPTKQTNHTIQISIACPIYFWTLLYLHFPSKKLTFFSYYSWMHICQNVLMPQVPVVLSVMAALSRSVYNDYILDESLQ